MKRRDFMVLAGSAAVLSFVSEAGAESVKYSEGVVEEQLAAGKTVFLDFFTTWCPTCRSQERAIGGLRVKNPAYDENMVFIMIDWDFHASSPISKKLKIPRRSTLVVLRGDQELGRIVAGTSPVQIKKLMNLGLPAS